MYEEMKEDLFDKQSMLLVIVSSDYGTGLEANAGYKIVETSIHYFLKFGKKSKADGELTR